MAAVKKIAPYPGDIQTLQDALSHLEMTKEPAQFIEETTHFDYQVLTPTYIGLCYVKFLVEHKSRKPAIMLVAKKEKKSRAGSVS